MTPQGLINRLSSSTLQSRRRRAGTTPRHRGSSIRRLRLSSPAVSLLLAAALALPSVWMSRFGDDYGQLLAVEGSSSPFQAMFTKYGLFVFADGNPERVRALVERGGLPWWSHPSLKIAFFRPLSSRCSCAERFRRGSRRGGDQADPVHLRRPAGGSLAGAAAPLERGCDGSAAAARSGNPVDGETPVALLTPGLRAVPGNGYGTPYPCRSEFSSTALA